VAALVGKPAREQPWILGLGQSADGRGRVCRLGAVVAKEREMQILDILIPGRAAKES
jgi:hypothetical protein